MVRLLAEHAYDHNFASMPLAIGVFISVSALVALCAKRARRASLKHEAETTNPNVTTKSPLLTPTPKSPLLTPKQLVTGLSGKVFPFMNKKKCGDGSEADPGNEFGEGGLWRKTILMGEKCRPPEFPGAIYYDVYGNRLSEPPQRSPRASPLPAGYTYPVSTSAN